MIAKIVKGSSFKGVVNYILDKGKDAKILVCDGLFAEDRDTIAMSFEAQSKMNPKVTKPVGHISLAFLFIRKMNTVLQTVQWQE